MRADLLGRARERHLPDLSSVACVVAAHPAKIGIAWIGVHRRQRHHDRRRHHACRVDDARMHAGERDRQSHRGHEPAAGKNTVTVMRKTMWTVSLKAR